MAANEEMDQNEGRGEGRRGEGAMVRRGGRRRRRVGGDGITCIRSWRMDHEIGFRAQRSMRAPFYTYKSMLNAQRHLSGRLNSLVFR